MFNIQKKTKVHDLGLILWLEFSIILMKMTQDITELKVEAGLQIIAETISNPKNKAFGSEMD